MKKIFLIFLFVFMLSVQSFAQIQNGFVRSQGTPTNPNGKRLSRVRVNIKGLHPEKVTDNNGNFNFNLGGGKTQFSILSVTLNDYRLLTKLSSSYNVGSAPIEIVMQSLTERQQNEMRIRQNVERNVSKSYNAKMAKLQKEIETLRNALSYEQKNKEQLQAQIKYLGTQVELLDNQYQHRHEIIDKMIEEYVDFDFAKADSTTTKIRSYIESGELEKADSILNATNIKQEMSDIRTLRSDIKSKESRLSNEKEILQSKIVRACTYWESKHNIALQRMQFDSAATYIKHLVEVDTCNVKNLLKCADFLSSQNVFKEAETYYQKCIQILIQEQENWSLLASSYTGLGILYAFTQRFKESEEMLNKALEISERFAKTNPEAYETLAVTYGNLANLYSKTQRFKESEEMSYKAIEISERFAKTNSEAYETNLAGTYVNLASLYSKTQRFKESEEMSYKAIEIFERLAKTDPKNYEPALAGTYFNLANFYSKAQCFQESKEMYNKAIELYERLTQYNPRIYKQSLAQSYINLALLYHNTQINLTEAVKWYRKAAEQGYATAQYNLAIRYETGEGVEKNLAEAVKWYRKAAEQGYAGAQNNLANRYTNGEGVEKNLAEAVKWFRKAAEQGYAKAQINLAIRYENGEGIEKNLTEAVKWFRKAAEQGYATAQYNLAVCYMFGKGVEKNLVNAAKWYRKAAEQGYAAAQRDLGLCYVFGDGVEKNLTEAVKWFRKAAEQGHTKARHDLAICYENGEGVEKNLTEAVKWYHKAAEQGDKDAKESLKRLGYSAD